MCYCNALVTVTLYNELFLPDDLQRQNEIFKSEVEMLQVRLKQFGQVQELASMLQQSHK